MDGVSICLYLTGEIRSCFIVSFHGLVQVLLEDRNVGNANLKLYFRIERQIKYLFPETAEKVKFEDNCKTWQTSKFVMKLSKKFRSSLSFFVIILIVQQQVNRFLCTDKKRRAYTTHTRIAIKYEEGV